MYALWSQSQLFIKCKEHYDILLNFVNHASWLGDIYLYIALTFEWYHTDKILYFAKMKEAFSLWLMMWTYPLPSCWGHIDFPGTTQRARSPEGWCIDAIDIFPYPPNPPTAPYHDTECNRAVALLTTISPVACTRFLHIIVLIHNCA